MTKAELRAEVFRRLNESATSPIYWTSDDVDTAVAAGYAELSDASEWDERSVLIDLLQDRPLYDLRTVLGPAFLAIGPAYNTTTHRWLLPSTVRMMDAHDRRWEWTTGEPQRFFLRGLWWLGLWPRTLSEAGQIKQYYVALPDALDSETDEPAFPGNFHYGIVEFAVADLFAQDGEADLALQAWAEYLRIEGGLSQWVADRAAGATMSGFGGYGGDAPR